MAAPTYATHMLDGLDALYRRTEDVLKSLQEILGFFKKISELEKQYGADLVKIAKRYTSSKICDEEIGTLRSGWDSMQQELENVGNKHSTLSDSIRKELCDSLTAYIKKKEADQKKLVKDGQKITRDMKASIADLHTAKGKFVSASKAADSAAGAYQKAKSEGTLKPKDLHKLNSKAQKAADLAHSADKEYQKQLEKTNQKQHSYYEQELPSLLKQFQDFEEERIHFLKQQFERYATFSSQFPPFLDMSCKCLKKAVDDINVDTDTQTYLEKNKTGISAPPDIQYEPYSPANEFVTAAGPSGGSSAGPSSPLPIVSGQSSFPAPAPISSRRDGAAPAPMPPSHGGGGHIIESNIPVAKENEVRKDVGLSRMDPNLPPEFKLQKLRTQLKEVRDAVRAERKTVKGLEKLVKFYASDPVAVEKTNSEVKDRKEKIADMRTVMNQLESEVAQLEAELGQAPSGGGHRDDDDDDGDADEHHHHHDDDWEKGEIVNEHAEEGYEEPVVIVKVRCLYPYTATNESELSFGQGDILSVTDQDDSGWWYAELDGKAGFVPKNYLEVVP